MTKEKVLITGASSGLGWQLAKEFAKNGHAVLLQGRNLQRLQELKNELGDAAEISSCELANQNELKKLAEFALRKDVKILVNNAGLNCPGKELWDLSLEQINEMIDVNLKAPMILTKLMLSQLTNIININSIVGLEVKKMRSIYSAAKWGLRGFSQSLKMELEGIEILDFYATNIKTQPDQQNAMESDFVAQKIYEAYKNKESEFILDGRKK